MSTSFNVPCRWTPDSTNAENEIREIFYQHWEKLNNRVIVTVNQINIWRQSFIEYVNKYVDDQIRDLTNDYDRQRLSLDEKREENLDTTRAYCGAQNADLFNELRNECRLLEFQVAQLEYINSTMNVVKVVTVQEQVERKKKEQSGALKSENDKAERKLIIEHTNNIQDNVDENGSSSIKLASSILNETHPHVSVVESLDHNNRSIDDHNNSQAHTMNTDDPINKCPICFMIFPLSMTEDNRSQHVNEHCTDE